MGNALSFNFPGRLRRVVVPEAKSHKLEEDQQAILAYVAATQELEAVSVRAITTSSATLAPFK